MKLRGTAAEIEEAVGRLWKGAPPMPAMRREMLDYQMMALWALAKGFNRTGVRILEIGTGHGGSGYMLAKGAPLAQVISLSIDSHATAHARTFWASQGLRNIEAELIPSARYLVESQGLFDMVWVDGDHNHVGQDLAWFNRLRENGLMLFHDYSPLESARPSPICFETLNTMARRLGRPFDIDIMDNELTGMVGFYRRPGERWE